MEGELTWKWNKIISSSVLLGMGYGDIGPRYYRVAVDNNGNYIRQERNIEPAFVMQADGNVFVSPFGNDKRYNFKIGTGLSLMYVEDTYGRFIGSSMERRVALGGNAIVEQEVTLAKKYLLGLKTTMQPYLRGDLNFSLLLKVGKKF